MRQEAPAAGCDESHLAEAVARVQPRDLLHARDHLQRAAREEVHLVARLALLDAKVARGEDDVLLSSRRAREELRRRIKGPRRV